MTKRRDTTDWGGALYTGLRATRDGVAGFCTWASAHRGRQIAESTMYKRLDGVPGERLPLEDIELATEYMQRDRGAHGLAFDWIHALAARWGLYVIEVEQPAESQPRCSITDMLDQGMKLFERGGRLAGLINRATSDHHICPAERDELVAAIDLMVRLLLRIRHNVTRAAEESK